MLADGGSLPGNDLFPRDARKEVRLWGGVEEEIEVVGINTCGGCSGKKAVTRGAEMVKRGADTIVLAPCIFKGLLLIIGRELTAATIRGKSEVGSSSTSSAGRRWSTWQKGMRS